MTIVEVIKALRRFWWALLLTLALGGLGAAQVRAAPTVYWATTKLVLAEPAAPESQRLAPTPPGSLIALAGLLEVTVNEGESIPRPASPDVTLVDQGLYNDAQVRVPNSGGQWANNFTEPALIVEASGPSENVVRQRINTLIERAEARLVSLQDESGVTLASRITFVAYPAPTIQQSGGRRSLATVVLVMLVLVAGCSVIVLLDHVWPRRRQPGLTLGSARLKRKQGRRGSSQMAGPERGSNQ